MTLRAELKNLAALFFTLTPISLAAQTAPEATPEASDPAERVIECRASLKERGLSLVARHCIVSCYPDSVAQSPASCDASYARFRAAVFPDQASSTPAAQSPAPEQGRMPRGRASQASTGPTSLTSVPDTIGYIRSRRGFHDLLNDDLEHRRLCGLRFEMKTPEGDAALRQLKEQTRIKLTGIEVDIDDGGRRVGTCKASDFEVIDPTGT